MGEHPVEHDEKCIPRSRKSKIDSHRSTGSEPDERYELCLLWYSYAINTQFGKMGCEPHYQYGILIRKYTTLQSKPYTMGCAKCEKHEGNIQECIIIQSFSGNLESGGGHGKSHPQQQRIGLRKLQLYLERMEHESQPVVRCHPGS